MRRLWLTPRWLGATALAALFALACVFLGQWQWARHEDRVQRADAIARNYGAVPVPLDRVLSSPGVTLTADQQWTRVTLSTSFDPSPTLFARNRPNQGTYGFEVLGVADAAGGRLVVDRGWAPYGADATVLPTVAPPPGGPVTLTGWLRDGEPDLDRSLPDNQLASINLALIATTIDSPVYQAYLVLDPASPGGASAGSGMAPLEVPVGDLGPHQAYAYQWWLVAPLGFVLVFQLVRTAASEGRERPPSMASARPKKVRIWDEEDG